MLNHKNTKKMKTLNEKIREFVDITTAQYWSDGEIDGVTYTIFKTNEHYLITSKNGIWRIKQQMHEYFTFTEIIKSITLN